MELSVLRFEKAWWKRPGVKEQKIREVFGWTLTQYYQRLNALVERPEAMAAEPRVVRRLQRMRARRMYWQ
ncbi:DUF3263 domain-containing protein [Actinorhabdospora filicis]|uniref:DUF3263 domain-containing protein n=1 Tax=Actinorhabdospora filicis TaxID=1785913 RepID=UPI002554C82B|nr:DUF3263 domain-containing protein [Actinorhabdospora filicis]